METTFTPIAGLAGGLLIGLAAVLLLLLNGRVAGISGILGASLSTQLDDRAWRLLFLLGLPAGAALGAAITGDAQGFAITSNIPLLVAGGVAVGIGTQLGSGCTSGHGVCGMARGSRRSIAATLIFMFVAGITVFVAQHLLGGAS